MPTLQWFLGESGGILDFEKPFWVGERLPKVLQLQLGALSPDIFIEFHDTSRLFLIDLEISRVLVQDDPSTVERPPFPPLLCSASLRFYLSFFYLLCFFVATALPSPGHCSSQLLLLSSPLLLASSIHLFPKTTTPHSSSNNNNNIISLIQNMLPRPTRQRSLPLFQCHLFRISSSYYQQSPLFVCCQTTTVRRRSLVVILIGVNLPSSSNFQLFLLFCLSLYRP